MPQYYLNTSINMLIDIFTQTIKPIAFIGNIINRPEIINNIHIYIFSYFLYIWISSELRQFVIEKLCCNEHIWIPSEQAQIRPQLIKGNKIVFKNMNVKNNDALSYNEYSEHSDGHNDYS